MSALVPAAAPLGSRRSLRWFFLVSFGIPWLGWTLVAVTGVGDSPLGTALFYTGDFMTVGGFVAAYVAGGRPGLMGLLRRYFQVAAPVPWALAAILLPFVWIALALLRRHVCLDWRNGQVHLRHSLLQHSPDRGVGPHPGQRVLGDHPALEALHVALFDAGRAASAGS